MRSENGNHSVTCVARHVAVVLAVLACVLSFGCQPRRQEATLAEKLTDQNPHVRQQTRHDVRGRGGDAVGPLLAAYASGNEQQRQAALESLGDIGMTSPVAAASVARGLAGIVMDAPDPKAKHRALLQMKRIGKAALPTLGDIVARTRASFMDPADAPPTIDILAAMLDIDRAESTLQLIKMLDTQEYAGYRGKIAEILQMITKRDFDMQHATSPEEEAEAVRKWKRWWKQEGREEMEK